MLDMMIASIIECSTLVKIDMIDTTYYSIKLNEPGELHEQNPIARYCFDTIGFPATYILTTGCITLTGLLLYNISPELATISVKALSIIELLVIADNDKWFIKCGYNHLDVKAHVNIIEYHF